MKCAIIGIGWLGKPLAAALIELGWEVTGTNRSGNPVELPHLSQLVFDPANENSSVEFLCHQSLVVLAFPPNHTTTNAYAEDCLFVCSQISDTCKVLLISSTSVYPDRSGEQCENDCIAALDSTNPLMVCEAKLRALLGNRLTVIRMAGLVGNNRWPIKHMSKSTKTYNGADPVNLIHQIDAIGICLHLITNDIFGETINACAPLHPPKSEYYAFEATKRGVPIPNFDTRAKPGKTINSDHIQALGYHFKLPNPFFFTE